MMFDVIVIALAAFALFRDLSHKNAWINHTIPLLPKHFEEAISWRWFLVFLNNAPLISVMGGMFLVNLYLPLIHITKRLLKCR